MERDEGPLTVRGQVRKEKEREARSRSSSRLRLTNSPSHICGATTRSASLVTANPGSITTAEVAAPRTMLAVLPFENLSGDSSQEYFSDGLTEETIARVGQLSPASMGVIARMSSMAYKTTSGMASDPISASRDSSRALDSPCLHLA